MKLKNAWKHLKTVLLHKWFVFLACARCGLLWQGIVHDMSKLSPSEFFEYARYFGDGESPRDVALRMGESFSAWQHHKGRNPHHWQYWVDMTNCVGTLNRATLTPLDMPKKYIAEMVCDWIGAGKAYGRNSGVLWSVKRLVNWYRGNIGSMIVSQATKEHILSILGHICVEIDLGEDVEEQSVYESIRAFLRDKTV